MNSDSGVIHQVNNLTFIIFKNKVRLETPLQCIHIEADFADRRYLAELKLAILMGEVGCINDVAYYTNKSEGKLRWKHTQTSYSLHYQPMA